MNTFDALPAIVVDDVAISLGAVLRRAQRTGHLQFLESAIKDHLVSRAIAARGLEALPEELARMRALLASEAEEHDLRRIITFGKLKEEVAGPGVEPYFERHRAEFDSAVLARIVVADLAAGARVKVELDAGVSFEELARRGSLDAKTRSLGGWLGRVRRRDLTPAEADVVFGAPVPKISPQISAPIAVGPRVVILRVDHFFRAELDQPTRAEIHELLFAQWLEQERRRSTIELKLFEVLS